MPRESQAFSRYFYSTLTIEETEIPEEVQQPEPNHEEEMASIFMSIGVSPLELFDLKLTRQVGQIFEDLPETMFDIEL